MIAHDQPTLVPLLSVRNLRVRFRVRGGGFINAVDDASLVLHSGRTLGIVGESGSGKSTLGRAILRLVPATGTVHFDGCEVLTASRRQMLALRPRMQMIFQDPAGSLNPRLRVCEIVGEPLMVHPPRLRGERLRREVTTLLERCGMPPDVIDRYPHEFSGGQRQRLAIARAIALRPKLIVCDEPTSALDVSIQAQILNLLRDLQRDAGIAYLFISHDMAVIDHMCDHIAVMHNGRIVEQGTRDQVIDAPQHPYTQRLLSAVPA